MATKLFPSKAQSEEEASKDKIRVRREPHPGMYSRKWGGHGVRVVEGHVGTVVGAQMLGHRAAIVVVLIIIAYLVSKEAARADMSGLVAAVVAAGVEHGQFRQFCHRQYSLNLSSALEEDCVKVLLPSKVCGLAASPILDPKLILSAGMHVSKICQIKSFRLPYLCTTDITQRAIVKLDVHA